MDIFIGQQQADGVIRHVAAYLYRNSNLPKILKTFYPVESRVTELINLGNLVRVRPTPYGKSTGYYDRVHCHAEIRDDKEKKGKHLPRYADSETEYLKLNGHLFLFKDGRWHYNNNGSFTTELPVALSSEVSNPLKELGIYTLSKKGEIDSVSCEKTTTWNTLQAKAEEEKAPYFIFRKDKLISTINHPLNRQ